MKRNSNYDASASAKLNSPFTETTADRNQGADEHDSPWGSHEAGLEGEHSGSRVSPVAREERNGVRHTARADPRAILRPIFVGGR